MRPPFVLTLLSEDGYQVFAALHQEYDTLDQAVEGAKSDYLKRYGGNPAFRVYHAEPAASAFRHTLIEVCFDESKRRSFVALYKVLQEVEPRKAPDGRPRLAIQAGARAVRRLVAYLGHLLPKPRGSRVILGFR